MGLITIPEFIIYDALNSSLKFIRSDYNVQSDKTQTFLYKLVNGLGVQKYQILEQAVGVFIGSEAQPNDLKISFEYDIQQITPPSIYIVFPSDSPSDDTLGNGENYEENIINEDGTISTVYTHRYSSTYQVVITSKNTTEAILLYHVLRSILISLNAHFELLGLKNIKFSGGDLQSYPLTPPNLYTKTINISFSYETSSLSINNYPALSQIILQSGKPIIL